MTVAEQIESTHEAFEAGASHRARHVRDENQNRPRTPRFRAAEGGRRAPLPRHDRAVLDRRAHRRGSGARRHAAAAPGHGLAVGRLQQLPDPRLRKPARSRRLARRRDADLCDQARDRGVRPQPYFQGGGDERRRAHPRRHLHPVRDGREERHAGRPRRVRLLCPDNQASDAERAMVRGGHRRATRSCSTNGRSPPAVTPARGWRTTSGSTATGSRRPMRRWCGARPKSAPEARPPGGDAVTGAGAAGPARISSAARPGRSLPTATCRRRWRSPGSATDRTSPAPASSANGRAG